MKRSFFAALVLVFVLVFSFNAYAFQNKTIWRNKADIAITGGLAVSDTALFAGDAAGKFYAFDKASGNLRWSYAGTNTIVGTPVIVGGNRVIFAQADGTVTCLNANSGDEIWVSSPANERDTVVDNGAAGDGKFFISRSDGTLCALDLNDGHLIWEYESNLQDLRNAPAFGEGYVFLGEQNGIFSIINPETGKRISGGGSGGSVYSPVVNGGNVYYSSWTGSVYAVKIKNVIPLWNINVGEPVTTAPAYGDNKLFVGTASGNIVAINATDSNIIWKFNTQGANVSVTPVYGDNLVFCGSSEGNFYAIDAVTGEEKYNFKSENGLSSRPVFANGVLYYASGNGSIYAVK